MTRKTALILHRPARWIPAAAIAIAAALALSQPALANDAAVEPGIILVSAEGSAQTVPDMAVIQLTVMRQAETARAALDASNAAMQDVLAAMKQAGIADRDLQTSDFSIQPQWNYHRNRDEPETPPTIVGYQVSNGLTVRIRELDNLGRILDESISLGVNQGGQIMFTNDDPEATLSEARRNAIAKATKKASEMAAAAGVALGRITQISEQAGARPPMPLMRAEMAMAKDAGAVPVATGENSYQVTVQMSWEIDQ
ncbi:SIMPL domain-containing protein [Pseudohoeflea coraliihabitans]|uniref:SIMPL domain-containing protein n=1 Tax=Pseudohoeflea coraliihabitans TaxID=2860393 RepID=A0ABS6WJE1_9HYPH|nr:SIMPL domain-containing protein [Pseudohoeflea sp. DP4N28-3]MBW3096056.1 SIMPL domain-containing protein [Pseudohoeflea sp. DP4N28-3]